MRLDLPRPGPVVKATMIVLGVVAVINAVLITWMEQSAPFRWLGADMDALLHGQIYRLVTAPVLTNPAQYSHVLFAIMALFFFGPSEESHRGGKKLIALMLGSAAFGSLLQLLVWLSPLRPLRTPFVYGPNAAIEALVVAWSMRNANATVRLFFVLPVRGSWFKWISLGFCALGLLYPSGSAEGAVAPFGGFVIGYLFGGSPSLVRRWFLGRKLGRLEKQSQDLRRGKIGKNAPPLRVVYGGLADELDDDERRGKKGRDPRTLN